MAFNSRFRTVATSITALASLVIAGVLTLESTITGDLTPTTDATYDIGTSDLRWKDLNASGTGTFEAGLVVEATDASALSVQDADGNPVLDVNTANDLVRIVGPNSPTSNLFQVQNGNDSTRYLTVSSTSVNMMDVVRVTTNQILLADGATSTPTLAFSTQTDTGFFTTSQGYMAFSTWGDHSGTFDGDNAELEIYDGYSTATGNGGWKELMLQSDDDTRMELISDGGSDTSTIYLTSGTVYGTIETKETGTEVGYMELAFNGGGAANLLINDFGVGFGIAPYTTNISGTTALFVPDANYAQIEQNFAGAPTASHCDHANEFGRIATDTTNNLLYWCMGATRAWDHLPLQDVVGTFNIKGNAVTPTANIFEIQNTTNNQRYMTVSSTSTALKGCTGSVSVGIVACYGTVGVITNSSDINAGAALSDFTLSNTAINANSVITATACGGFDGAAFLVVNTVPSTNTATMRVRNVGSSNQTSDWKICFHVFNPSTP